MAAAIPPIPFDVPPFRLSGTVYGALLNHRSAFEAMAPHFDRPPYHAPPRAPVLYIKPRNTLSTDGAVVEIPAEAGELEVGACLGLVLARTATRVSEHGALGYLAGFLIVNDVSVPHPDYYRPSIRYKIRDGFCPLGPKVTPASRAGDPGALGIRTFVDGTQVQAVSTADLMRPAARLLAEVSQFMTLAPGDVLALGAAAPAPRVRAGQTVTIEIDGLGRLTNRFVMAGA